MLTHDEIMVFLDLLSKKYGRGYAKTTDVYQLGTIKVRVGPLQAKLSIMAEVQAGREKKKETSDASE